MTSLTHVICPHTIWSYKNDLYYSFPEWGQHEWSSMITVLLAHSVQFSQVTAWLGAKAGLQRFYAVVAGRREAISRSIRANSLISSRTEYRLGVLLWRNSLSSLESLGRRAVFSWASASSFWRTTSLTSWLRPWGLGCWDLALWWGLLLMTSRFRRSAWQVEEWTEIRTWREQRT